MCILCVHHIHSHTYIHSHTNPCRSISFTKAPSQIGHTRGHALYNTCCLLLLSFCPLCDYIHTLILNILYNITVFHHHSAITHTHTHNTPYNTSHTGINTGTHTHTPYN